MRRCLYILAYAVLLSMTTTTFASSITVIDSDVEIPKASETIETEVVYADETTPETTVAETTYIETEPIIEETTAVTEPVTTEPVEEFYISEEDIRLIALVTMAEAESQCEEGLRLVIDTILNRLDSSRFPNTVVEVIYAPGQFECMWNGRVERCYVRDDIYELVKSELRSRTDNEVLFFTSEGFFSWATPKFKVGDHYFSS